MQQYKKQIINLFEKYEVEGFVNIYHSNGKNLEYNPLFDEISYDGSENISTSLTVIKNHRKSHFSLDGFSVEKLESAFSDVIKTLDFAQYDEDIIMPDITDSKQKDFKNNNLENISFKDLEQEFEKVKSYNFKQNISLEGCSFGVNSITQYYINSLGSFKSQSDNSYYYYVDIFGENGEIRDNHYEYKTLKNFEKITPEFLENLENDLLGKIGNTSKDFEEGIYDITLERDVVIDFLEIIIENLSAESMREGMSLFLKNMIGDEIFGGNFTLINHQELDGYTGNRVFDKEGVTCITTTLFENGVLKNKFFDYKNALKEGMEFLGNSGVGNIELVGEGDENYLKGSKVLFTNLMAFHTVDMITGKFALMGEGYLLENGEKTQYLKNISLTGNIIDLFSNIKSFGTDVKKGGNFKVPSVSFCSQKIV